MTEPDERLAALLDEYWGLPATQWRDRQPGLRDKVNELERSWKPWLETLANADDGYSAYQKRVREMWDVFRVARWLVLVAPIGLIYALAELVRLLRAGAGG